MKNILLLIALTTLFSCGKNQEVKPIIKDIKELVFASGQLEWDNAYNLTAQTDGVLENVNFEIGQMVSKETVLATINNPNNLINTKAAQDQLRIANQNLKTNAPALQQLQQNIDFANSKYLQDKLVEERYQRLYKSESVAKIAYENMKLNAAQSLANLNALKEQYAQVLQQAQQQQINAKGQYQNTETLKNYNNIVVAESGTIINKYKTTGDYVRKGEVIATIADDKKVEAVLNVDEKSIAKIKIGQKVFVRLNTDKNLLYEATVSEILAAFNQQTQSFICKATFNQPLKNILFGTQLEANILIGEKKNTLLIPRSYMGFGNKVNIKGTDDVTIIKTGIISTEYVEVLEGLTQESILLPLKP